MVQFTLTVADVEAALIHDKGRLRIDVSRWGTGEARVMLQNLMPVMVQALLNNPQLGQEKEGTETRLCQDE